MNVLNLWEKSEKTTYKKTELQDSIENKNPELAIWSLHINSVGFTLTTLVVLLIVFVLIKHVNMPCVKKM